MDTQAKSEAPRAELRLDRAQGPGSQAGSLLLLHRPHLDDAFTRPCPSQTRGDLAASRPCLTREDIPQVSITRLGGSSSISHDGIFWIVCALSVPCFESFCGTKRSSSSRSGYLDFSPRSTGSSGSILQFTEDAEGKEAMGQTGPRPPRCQASALSTTSLSLPRSLSSFTSIPPSPLPAPPLGGVTRPEIRADPLWGSSPLSESLGRLSAPNTHLGPSKTINHDNHAFNNCLEFV